MDYLLTDAQWARIAPLLPGREGTKGGRGQDNRRFVEAVRWLTRNGCRWRALPAAQKAVVQTVFLRVFISKENLAEEASAVG